MPNTSAKSDPLAELRSKLKSGKPGTTPATSSKSDPLASVREKLKATEPASSQASKPSAPTGVLPAQSSTEGRLQALELVVNALAAKADLPGEIKTKLGNLKQDHWNRAQ